MTDEFATGRKGIIPLVMEMTGGPCTEFGVPTSTSKTLFAGQDRIWLAPLAEEEYDAEYLPKVNAQPIMQPEAEKKV